MIPQVKICGLNTPAAVDAAVQGGADYLGFIFFPKSPRNVSPLQAAGLVPHNSSAKTVAVTVNADDDLLDEIANRVKPDFLQLHGGESRSRMNAIKKRFALPLIRAFSIREPHDLDQVVAYQDHTDMVLLDAKPPADSELPGGNGVRFNWSLVESFRTRLPVLLSGGIDLENVPHALRHVAAADNALVGIDVSSGVESAPGVKDVQKIRQILETCRAAEFLEQKEHWA